MATPRSVEQEDRPSVRQKAKKRPSSSPKKAERRRQEVKPLARLTPTRKAGPPTGGPAYCFGTAALNRSAQCSTAMTLACRHPRRDLPPGCDVDQSPVAC